MHVDATVDRYRHLLSPGRIGTLELRNRIVMCPMGDNLAQSDGYVSDVQMDYFEARARGGAGLILVGCFGHVSRRHLQPVPSRGVGRSVRSSFAGAQRTRAPS